MSDRFGFFTVMHATDRTDSEGRKVFVMARCDCGTVKEVNVKNLRTGGTKSCGCQRRRLQVERSTVHGLSRSPEYKVWRHIKDRCLNPSDDSYPLYGGRGITICDAWRDSFETFYADVGPRPFKGATIDRIENDKGYEPGNVRWATIGDQNRNKRHHRVIEHLGVKIRLCDAAQVFNLTPQVLWYRLEAGWSVDEALNRPTGMGRKSLENGVKRYRKKASSAVAD